MNLNIETMAETLLVADSDANAKVSGTLGPLEFAPLLKRARWGGTRLGSLLGKEVGSGSEWAESWEVADLPADQSVVQGGPCATLSLQDLVREHSVLLLGRHAGHARFPLLCKFLDASDRLSVQVHPDDAYAARHGLRNGGKSEAWVVVAAEAGSRIYAGLRSGITRERLQSAMTGGTVEECLESHIVSVGDCFNIPAGTVHAIGEGVVIAEVQQPSDLTFRLFDWNRTDAQGQPRALHFQESLDCTDFDASPVAPAIPRRIRSGEGVVEELLSTPHFDLRRFSGAGNWAIEDDDRCHVLMVLDGSGQLASEGELLDLARGRTVLLPAHRSATRFELSKDGIILDAYLP